MAWPLHCMVRSCALQSRGAYLANILTPLVPVLPTHLHPPAGDKEHLKNLAGDMGAVKGAGLGTVQVGQTTRRHIYIYITAIYAASSKSWPQCGSTANGSTSKDARVLRNPKALSECYGPRCQRLSDKTCTLCPLTQ